MTQESFPPPPPPDMCPERPTLPKISVPSPRLATRVTTTSNAAAPTSSTPEVNFSQSNSINQIMDTLESSLRALKTQADEQMSASSSSRDRLRSELEDVGKKVNEQNQRHRQQLEIMQKDFDSKLNAKIEDAFTAQLSKSVAKGVKVQAPDQIHQLLKTAFGPISLQRQLEEIKERKAKLITELLNSKARCANNRLVDKTYLSDPIRPVVVHGTGKSKLFPTNISSFVYYTDEQILQLFKDYNLKRPSPNRNANMNRVLAYIGVPFRVEADAPCAGLPTPTSPVTGKSTASSKANDPK
ncbi:hypothetical protein BDV98DRAFT_589959 [Pterulicium gracile]|uniref:Uncharacterized protein n=1 Tax=Pterulicium gracile TaxID=1884261 RepID=A0A5C3QXX3_9AGAR|nr:hypothetical protein BDV98DRAFT_589959 [Pterula gracilis]